MVDAMGQDSSDKGNMFRPAYGITGFLDALECRRRRC
jgi:hypothetical protein